MLPIVVFLKLLWRNNFKKMTEIGIGILNSLSFMFDWTEFHSLPTLTEWDFLKYKIRHPFLLSMVLKSGLT